MTNVLLTQNEYLQKRFKNLSEFIPYLQKTTQLEPWHRTVLGCIVIRLRTHFRHLSVAYHTPYEPEYIAWAARNLLELAIWAKYATRSKENAKQLHHDQVIDMAELQKGTVGLLHKYEPSHPELATLQQQGEWLKKTKGEMGLEEDGKHLNIGTVAKEVGMAALFYGLNGLLSKLVHPTSFSIMLEMDHTVETQLRSSLFALGQGAAEDALRDLVAYFDSVGIDSRLLRP